MAARAKKKKAVEAEASLVHEAPTRTSSKSSGEESYKDHK